MNPTLFDMDPTAGRVRATDPDTSRRAARRPRSYARLRELMADGEHRTPDQIWHALGGVRSTVHGMVSRAHGDGLLIEVGTALSDYGCEMTVFRIADRNRESQVYRLKEGT